MFIETKLFQLVLLLINRPPLDQMSYQLLRIPMILHRIWNFYLFQSCYKNLLYKNTLFAIAILQKSLSKSMIFLMIFVNV